MGAVTIGLAKFIPDQVWILHFSDLKHNLIQFKI